MKISNLLFGALLALSVASCTKEKVDSSSCTASNWAGTYKKVSKTGLCGSIPAQESLTVTEENGVVTLLGNSATPNDCTIKQEMDFFGIKLDIIGKLDGDKITTTITYTVENTEQECKLIYQRQ